MDSMQDRMLFLISAPRSGSTLLQRMLGSHTQIFTYPEPHLITPLAYLGYHDLVDKAPYDHINAAEAVRSFVAGLPNMEADYLDAVRAYTDTLYGRMLAPSGKRYFLDKTPANALVMPFLTKLYPRARYVVLTRHPLEIASSYANGFFAGDWRAANTFNPVVNRYVPAIARVLREPPLHLCQVDYARLTREPETQLARLFAFLELDHQPDAVNYADHFPRTGHAHTHAPGRGDPYTVDHNRRPIPSAPGGLRHELAASERARTVATQIVAALDPEDVRTWGFEHAELLAGVTSSAVTAPAAGRPKRQSGNRSYRLQRRILLALKKDIRRRPHGHVLERIRYYCNVLLRE
jgi:hypothetical protein